MKIFKYLHRLTLVVGLLTVVVPILFWSRIPDVIPMHYNAAGEVDNWADKSSIILIFFVIFMLMGVMSIAIYFVKTNMQSQYSSSAEKNEMSFVYPVIVCMNLAIQCMFSYIVFCVVTARNLGNLFMPIFIGAAIGPLVYFFAKRPKKELVEYYKEKEKQEQGEVYRSKVDWWLGILLGGSCVWLVYLAVEPIVRTGKVEWFIIGTALVICIIIVPLFNIKYVMYKDHLLISMSFYGKERIRYKDIVHMKLTNNPLASAALSLKRLQIDYVENGVQRIILISPKNRKEFIKIIEEKKM